MKKVVVYGMYLLAVACIFIIYLVVTYPKSGTLTIVACDVGQGDGLLVYDGVTQIIIDGGANNKILECIAKHMPFWDRAIDLVIMTHPQEDHYKGLIEVFSRYEVKAFLLPPIDSSNLGFEVLETLVGGESARVIYADDWQKMRLGLIYLDIVWPTDQYNNEHSTLAANINSTSSKLSLRETKEDPNNFSVVSKLSYGDFDALFTGDISPETLGEVIAHNDLSNIEYLKVPHHGSKNGLTQIALNEISPEIAVISSGKGNRYGHPHKEVLEMLLSSKAQIFRTDTDGDIVVKTDGVNIWVAK
jgi:competence protein ComEC